MRHGGQILIDQLEAQGVSSVFLVPGESFLPALDALYDTTAIRTIVCRHEGGAAMMAEATGRLTGRPGVAFSTRGPGAVNALSGVYIASQNATPMILVVGLPATRLEDRAPFQGIDVERLYAPLAKWTATVRATDRIPEYAARAVATALSGRPGPVVLGIPEDVFSGRADVKDASPVVAASPAPSPAAMAEIGRALARARRPLVIVGGPGWSAGVQARVEGFALAFDLPVAAAFRAQDYVDNRHPCYVGHAGIAIDGTLAEGIASADVLIVVGAELGEVTTGGYELIAGSTPGRMLIHVHPDLAATGAPCRADLSIAATSDTFTTALTTLEPPVRRTAGRKAGQPSRQPWSKFRRDLRAAYEASLVPQETSGDVRLGEIVRSVSDLLPERAIVTSGAGNYAQFLHRTCVYKGYPTQLAPLSGSMGYGLPAAIAAKLWAPDRPVVAFAGDGCFQMTGQELATAVQYALPLVVVVANNGMHGTIRMHQERQYPGRVMGTSLVNPDFAALARSFGARGVSIAHTSEFEGAFRRALGADKPTLIELKLDPEAIAPGQTLASLRARRS